MRPTQQEHREINRLRENRVLIDFLERELVAEQDKLVTMTDMDQLRVLQGGCRRLREILSLIQTDAT